MYRRFYTLYGNAGRLFVGAFSDNPSTLLSIEIYPSHPDLYKTRQRLVAQELGADEALKELLSPEQLSEALEQSRTYTFARTTQSAADAVVSQPSSKDSLGSQHTTEVSETHPDLSRYYRTIWIVLACIGVTAAGLLVVVRVIRQRQTKREHDLDRT